MSKAFVSEDRELEHDDGPESGDQPLPAKNYITHAGHRRLKEELLNLLDVERPEVVQTVAWAASNGDRSENGDYIYGKRRLREIDRRIRFLTKRLDAAVVVDPSVHAGNDQIFFGATVTYADAEGAERTVTIVGVDEVEPERGRISWISPVAQAMLKAREGDVVSLRSPAGLLELEVIAVRYPEAGLDPD
ncbi:MAG: transcription elongation factor GreB [Burkholderiales bacterium]|nr:MAG: transcription elongation factor GreB [Burkholderiales bacterium]